MSSVLMGPYATQLLGEMGADIIKVEAPDGDVVRLIGPSRSNGMGPIFLNTNRSKRSICLDLKKEVGRNALLRLAETADVFFYNVRPQAMARLGLAYEDLAAVNPKLIYVGVFGYGQDGPYAAKPAYDDLMQGATGVASFVAQSTGGPPRYVPLAMVDRITGMAAVNATLAALYERSISGMGQRIDVPMFETMVGFVLSDHLGGLTFDPPLDQGGYARLLSQARRPYKTMDGYICAMVYTDQQWRNFYRLLGREGELDADRRLLSLKTRSEYVDELYSELEEILSTKTTSEWLDQLSAADIPVTPVHDQASIFNDEHLVAINYFGYEEHPSEGRLRTLRHPQKWSRTQPRHSRTIPLQGEHGIEILREGGFSDREISDLAEDGALILKESPEEKLC
ncbi:crotonobetainyl-CoA:carnitine CoA-transferase CaiB-like acyl-CoA transferase [Parapusillimonas granuli]|nr:crotonobetainyl-CoA:carnitine CoA-transferase CaiB-like acyl-CoA transferase [Parapusillimonas granuli]